MFYETDVGKHNDKNIKRTAKDATELSVQKKSHHLPLRHMGVYCFLTEGLETVKALAVLIKDFEEDKITLICKRTLSSQ